jgi:hypothetical protein
MCITGDHKMRRMEKTQGYLREEELDALRQAAARTGRSVAELIGDAIRKGRAEAVSDRSGCDLGRQAGAHVPRT